MSVEPREKESGLEWVACWSDAPEDALTSAFGHTLVPGGRWLLELLISSLEKRDCRVTGIGFEYSGYWWVHVDFRTRRFLLSVYYLGGVGNVRVEPRRPLIGWLIGRDYSEEAREFAGLILEVLQGDRRVERAKLSSGYIDE